MTLQQLRYVITVAQKGSISEAAKELFISQPSLSNAIKELEKEMKIIIFSRTNKGIIISDEGLEFLGYARQVLEQAELLENRYLETKSTKKRFNINQLFIAKPHIFVSNTNPLAQKDIVTLEDIEPFPYLSFEQGQYNSFYFSEEILSTLVHQKIIKVSDRATLFNLLIGLDGYTISTGIISEELNGKNIIAIPLAVDETIKIGYIVRNDTARSYLGQIFIEALKQNTQELMQGV